MASDGTMHTMPAVDARRRAPLPSNGLRTEHRSPVARTVSLDRDDRALAADRALLSAAERAHADRGTALVGRHRTALRAELRRLVGEVLGMPPADVPLRAGTHGRPELDVPGTDVSCSRSDGRGLVALSLTGRLGIDLERITPWHDDVLDEGWLSPGERAALRDLDPASRALAAARCWSRKEALLKGIGTGLTDAMADLEVGVDDRCVAVGGWSVGSLPAPPGTVAGIATLPDRPLPSATSAAPERRTRGHVHL